jgi:hypothetical protein
MDARDPDSIHPALGPLVLQLDALGARDNAMPRADIDLAVDAPDIDPRTWSDMLEAVENAQTLLEIDCARLQDASGTFLENILREGKVIYDAG